MGMIRVSDYAEERIRKMAAETGRTVTSTVDALVEGSGGVDLIVAVDKRFDELKKLIEDTTVDRVAGSSRPTNSSAITMFLPWENCMQDIYDDFPEGEEWLAGVRENWGNSDCMDMASFFVKGDEIWSDFYGTKTPLLKLTPKLVEYLHTKGYDV